MTTRSNAGRARRRGHGDCDIAAVHDIELHSDISSNTHEAPTLRGCGGNSVARSCAAGRGSRAAASCHEEGIAEPLLGEMPVCYGGRLVSRGDVGRRETGASAWSLGTCWRLEGAYVREATSGQGHGRAPAMGAGRPRSSCSLLQPLARRSREGAADLCWSWSKEQGTGGHHGWDVV